MAEAGRTEAEVAADIADAIIAAGHATVDFTIVARRAERRQPAPRPSDRVIARGRAGRRRHRRRDADGYCSDSTRTYAVGEPPRRVRRATTRCCTAAQRGGRARSRPGVTAEAVDAAARDVINAAGYGELFLHRTGHGIGLETHEDPYIVAGNELPLEPGMAFSIEPGIYLAGRHGARIEDIVVSPTTAASSGSTCGRASSSCWRR